MLSAVLVIFERKKICSLGYPVLRGGGVINGFLK